MKLIYNVNDRPKAGQIAVFALQQLLAILAATIAVPAIVGNGMSQSAALFGAGVGTIVYLLLTKFRSPVFLGSSFAFLPSMFAAFAGGVSASLGFLGLIIGAAMAGLIYVIIAVVIRFCGAGWVNKLMPAVIIGPTVAIIGLSLSSNAVLNSLGYANADMAAPFRDANGGFILNLNSGINLICALVTLTVIIICSVYGKKMAKMIPFIIGICAGYLVALCFTLIGNATENDALKILSFDAFSNMKWIPEFTFLKAFSGEYTYGDIGSLGKYIAVIAVAYIPVAFVVFAEHIADHKNLSSIIEADLLEDPGLHRTLLGDGIGSMAGAFFGGCPNTTYGESVGCVAISGNASVVTTVATAALAIVASFIAPFTTFLATIPTCVMGGVCITLYGFIAVSGLKMLQKVDLDKNRNLFPASIILICGVGGMRLVFGQITVTSIAVALILGILANVILAKGEKKEEAPAAEKEEKSDKAE
ncbi:MAG: uracil-xanthine permease [Clostridia bacterium]|nr:uracil-xanthine permease [Clostridia bacterium]